jgi:putative sigma-54 modulation protein
MKISCSFLHLEHTPALDQKIQDASEKIAKLFEDQGSLRWFCYVQNNEHVAELNVVSHHSEFHSKATSENLYESINQALAKIKKQALKQKGKYNKIHRERLDFAA